MNEEVDRIFKALTIIASHLELAGLEIKQIYTDLLKKQKDATEEVQKAFPPDLAGLLYFETADDYVLVKARQYLESDNFRKVAEEVLKVDNNSHLLELTQEASSQ